MSHTFGTTRQILNLIERFRDICPGSCYGARSGLDYQGRSQGYHVHQTPVLGEGGGRQFLVWRKETFKIIRIEGLGSQIKMVEERKDLCGQAHGFGSHA